MLCLGDQNRVGIGVGDEIPYPRQLEQMLKVAQAAKRVETINTGVQRYFTYQEIDVLRNLVEELKPDVVTLGIYYNDLGVRPEGEYSREYENAREQSASAFRKRAEWLYLALKNSALIELAKQSYLSGHAGERYLRVMTGEPSKKEEAQWVAMKQELQAFHDLADEYDFQPLVVTIPSRIQVQQAFPESRFPGRVLEICGQLQIPVLNVHEQFVTSLKAGEDPYLAWDNHMSEVGHRIVAEALAAKIAESQNE